MGCFTGDNIEQSKVRNGLPKEFSQTVHAHCGGLGGSGYLVWHKSVDILLTESEQNAFPLVSACQLLVKPLFTSVRLLIFSYNLENTFHSCFSSDELHNVVFNYIVGLSSNK